MTQEKKQPQEDWYCGSCKETIVANGEHLCDTENWIKEFDMKLFQIVTYENVSTKDISDIKSFISTLIEQTEARVSKIEQIRCEEMVEKAKEEALTKELTPEKFEKYKNSLLGNLIKEAKKEEREKYFDEKSDLVAQTRKEERERVIKMVENLPRLDVYDGGEAAGEDGSYIKFSDLIEKLKEKN